MLYSFTRLFFLIYFVKKELMTQHLIKPKIILLVGMMGVGKTSLGRIIAGKLRLPFIDSDREIEAMTGFTISDLFARYGEAEFRKGEERVMARLLTGKPCVLSSGGGAFLSEATRLCAKKNAISVWIKAEADVISGRTQGRTHRPLVPAADNQRIIERLVQECYPVYAQADITIPSYDEHPSRTAVRLMKALEERAIVSPFEPKPKRRTHS